MKILILESVATANDAYKAGTVYDVTDEFGAEMIRARVATPAKEIADKIPATIKHVKGRTMKADKLPAEII